MPYLHTEGAYSDRNPVSTAVDRVTTRRTTIPTPFQTKTRSARRAELPATVTPPTVTPPPSSLNLSFSSSDSDDFGPKQRYLRMAPAAAEPHVEQDGPKRIPILTEGDPSPEAVQEFENGCLDYFGEREIAEDKQTSKILPGFKDPRIRAFITANRARLATLAFEDFMKEFRGLFLAPDWEGTVRRKLMSASMGTRPFWDYATAVQNLNILLINTILHLPDNKLRHQLEVGMTEKLARKCQTEKTNEIEDLQKWMLEVKRIDDGHRAEIMVARTTRHELRKANGLSEPSRCANTNNSRTSGGGTGNQRGSGSSVNPASGSTRPRLPKLTEGERTILHDNQGCLKCRKLLVDHHMANCPNGFPDPITYHTLTQKDVDAARARTNRNVGAVSRTSPEPEESPSHPVAAVMPRNRYPATYFPPNKSCVIGEEESSGSDSDVSSPIAPSQDCRVTAAITPSRLRVLEVQKDSFFIMAGTAWPVSFI
jgi:hypothetical protein